jgi:hypothetical protein
VLVWYALTFGDKTVHLGELVLQAFLEVFERQHDDGNVVEGLVRHTGFHDLLDDVAARLVDLLVLRVEALLGGDPALLEDLGVTDLVENAVT